MVDMGEPKQLLKAWGKIDMPKEKLKFILLHLLRSQVKLDDAPASAQSHFDLAIVELDKLIEDYQDSDPECNQVLTEAKEHITMYHQGT